MFKIYFTPKLDELKRVPRPIILENLSDGLSINGETQESITDIDSSLHRDILILAVQLAKAVWNN